MTEDQQKLLTKAIGYDFLGGTVIVAPPQVWKIDGKDVPGTAFLAVNMTKPTGNLKPYRAVILTGPALQKLKEILNGPYYEYLMTVIPGSISEVPEEFANSKF